MLIALRCLTLLPWFIRLLHPLAERVSVETLTQSAKPFASRTCRARLQWHNSKRRKRPEPAAAAPNAPSPLPNMSTRKATRSRSGAMAAATKEEEVEVAAAAAAAAAIASKSPAGAAQRPQRRRSSSPPEATRRGLPSFATVPRGRRSAPHPGAAAGDAALTRAASLGSGGCVAAAVQEGAPAVGFGRLGVFGSAPEPHGSLAAASVASWESSTTAEVAPATAAWPCQQASTPPLVSLPQLQPPIVPTGFGAFLTLPAALTLPGNACPAMPPPGHAWALLPQLAPRQLREPLPLSPPAPQQQLLPVWSSAPPTVESPPQPSMGRQFDSGTAAAQPPAHWAGPASAPEPEAGFQAQLAAVALQFPAVAAAAAAAAAPWGRPAQQQQPALAPWDSGAACQALAAPWAGSIPQEQSPQPQDRREPVWSLTAAVTQPSAQYPAAGAAAAPAAAAGQQPFVGPPVVGLNWGGFPERIAPPASAAALAAPQPAGEHSQLFELTQEEASALEELSQDMELCGGGGGGGAHVAHPEEWGLQAPMQSQPLQGPPAGGQCMQMRNEMQSCARPESNVPALAEKPPGILRSRCRRDGRKNTKDSPVSLLDCRCWCCLLAAMIAAQRAAAEGAVRWRRQCAARCRASPAARLWGRVAGAGASWQQPAYAAAARAQPAGAHGFAAPQLGGRRKHQPAAEGAARPGPAAGEAAQRLGVFGAAW